MKKSFIFGVFFAFLPLSVQALPRNVILFIGDGMGTEHIKAAGYFLYGKVGNLSFEQFPYRSLMTTDAHGGALPDSASSATSMATGVKVRREVISQRSPGDGSNLQTLGEFFKSKGKRFGIVTTADLTDATPAAFGAHSPNRKKHGPIIYEFLSVTKPNVLFGASAYIKLPDASQAGYTTIETVTDLLSKNVTKTPYLFAQFSRKFYMEWEFHRLTLAPDQPSLSQMTRRALDALDVDPDGFFLVVENELIDNAGHNDIPADSDRTRLMIEEVKSLADAVQVARTWAESRPDTLIVVASDHETGDFAVLSNRGSQGVVPQSKWNSKDHTRKRVPVYGWGSGPALSVAAGVIQVTDNTDIFRLLSAQWGK